MLAPSSLSRACRSVAEFVEAGIGAVQADVQVTVGAPAALARAGTDAGHRLNLFFYKLEPGGVDMHPAPGDVWRLRLHCLITPFSIDEDGVAAGEHDLRVLGEVVRLFHERPVLDTLALDDGEAARLHAVFQTLTLDELNHLWSTQGEVTQRPCVAYELALAPVLPRRRTIGAPRVGAIGYAALPFEAVATAPAPAPRAPEVERVLAFTGAPDWVPHICFVDDDEARFALSLPVPAPDDVRVWIAGEPGATVTLAWETWSPEAGWVPGPRADAPVGSAEIDPDGAAQAPTTEVALPFADRAGQAALHAERTFRRPDGAEIVLRSNPLLVTVTEAAP